MVSLSLYGWGKKERKLAAKNDALELIVSQLVTRVIELECAREEPQRHVDTSSSFAVGERVWAKVSEEGRKAV